MPKCNKCPLLKLVESRIIPEQAEKSDLELGRINIDVVRIKGKGADWLIPQDCIDGLLQLLKAEDAICGHK